MTKRDIVQKVHEQVGLPASTVARLVDDIFEIVKDRLTQGDDVKIVRFGRFEVQQRAARRGRNPVTGDEIVIPERRVLTFRPSKSLKDRL